MGYIYIYIYIGNILGFISGLLVRAQGCGSWANGSFGS